MDTFPLVHSMFFSFYPKAIIIYGNEEIKIIPVASLLLIFNDF